MYGLFYSVCKNLHLYLQCRETSVTLQEEFVKQLTELNEVKKGRSIAKTSALANLELHLSKYTAY